MTRLSYPRVAKMLSIEQQTLLCGCVVNTNRFQKCVHGAAKKFFQSRIALYSQDYVAGMTLMAAGLMPVKKVAYCHPQKDLFSATP